MQYVDRKEFEEQLKLCKIVSKKNACMPILQNVKLTMTKDSLMMHATDLENAYICTMPYDEAKQYRVLNGMPEITKEPIGQSVCIPISNLMKGLKAIPKKVKKVSVEILDKTCCGDKDYFFKINGALSIIGQDPEDFPRLPKIPFGGYHKVLDIEGINKIKDATLKSERTYRSFIQGIYFDFDNERMVAVDSHRIHLTSLAKSDMGNFTISNDAISFLWVSRKNVSSWLAQDKNNIYIQMKHGIFIGRKVEGEFPDYDILLRKNHTSYFWAENKVRLAEVVNEAATILDNNHVGITLSLNNKITIKSQNPEIGEFEKQFNGRYIYQGPPIEIALNKQYLIEAMKQIPNDESFMMQFKGNAETILIETMDKTFQAYVMPMRKE